MNVCVQSAETIPEEKLQNRQLIGSGGFGQVFRARHTDWGQDVALKKLSSNHVEQGLEELLREAEKMLSATSIDHVLRLYGLCRCEDACYGLVMEYMENGSLHRLFRLVRPLPWALRFRVLHEVTLGMNRLHSLSPPLLHLDLKPQNVLLNEDLHIKISDFGLSRFKRGTTLPQDAPPADGTLEYTAPELLCSVNCCPTKASDVYSYAILIWCVLTGQEPYENALPSLIMLHVPRGQRPSLDHLGDLQRVQKLADMKHLMEKCWDQDPSSRPSFKDCVVTTEEIFMAHKQQVKEAVRNVQSALEKMETSSQQSLSRVPPCSALSSGPSSEIVERFPTLTLLEPPSLENGAVPLGSPAAPSAEPSCPAPPSASSEKAQKGTPRVTRWPPNEKERPDPVPQQPASSAQGKPQGKGAWERHAAAPSQIRHPSPVPRRSHIFLTGSQLSNIQIGNNNVMEVRSTTVTRSKKKK